LIRSADIRYAGQSYELTVPWNATDPAAPFHREHQRVYGYANPERAVEIVTLRLRSRVEIEKPNLLSQIARSRQAKKPIIRRIHSGSAWHATPAYPRASLAGGKIAGPALILDYGSTTLIPPGWNFSVDKFGNLIARRRKP
jgi:N-methylhydantoinase A